MNFKSEPYGTEENSHMMEWVAESISDITEFKLQYKEDNSYYLANSITDTDDSWIEVKVQPQSNGDNFYTGKTNLRKLSPATRYLARVSSKNDYGFSKYSQPFSFATKGAGKISITS